MDIMGEMMEVIDRLKDFYTNLNKNSVNSISDCYHHQIEFTDPVSTFTGLPAVTRYFEALLQKTQQCEFVFKQVDRVDDHLYVHWLMLVTHPRINSGRPYQVSGLSFMKINDERVCYQRDYYDMGELLYEKLPVLKHAIRWLKKGMEQ